MERLGTGIGWRPEIADAVERMPGIDWVEVVAENVCPGHLPDSLRRLRERGVTVVPHGVSLGLGGADRPDERRLAALAERAEALRSPLVTEHIAFVRAGGALTASPGLEAGHLLPVPRTRDALDVLCENVRIAQDALPVPLAVENIAALLAWPGEEMTEGQFLYDLADRTGVRLLVDVANLHTNHVNRGEDPARALAELPLEALAYVHVAGGFTRDGVWHDSHAHPVPQPVLDILTDLASRVTPPGVLLERDDNFPQPAALEAELTSIGKAVEKGRAQAVPRQTSGPTTRRESGTAARGETGTAARGETGTAARRESQSTARCEPEGTARDASGTAARGETGTAARRESESTARREPEGTARDASGTAVRREPEGTARDASGTAARGGTGTAARREPESTARRETDGAARGASGTAARGASGTAGRGETGAAGLDVVRQRVALAQTALLSALVAGTPVPEGFDRVRIGVQARALAGKRADVVAKVAPELPEILGAEYRPAFLAYAQRQPMGGGYRRDALDFAAYLLRDGRLDEGPARQEVRAWWRERSGPVPYSRRPGVRIARAARRVLPHR
ncbi:MbnB/TglH/ChrH family RiPP precursor modification enzyme [Streptomyces sp. 7R007]